MPRALTEEEKCAQCEQLLEKGKAVVFAYGMRKVSVDDIAGAAGLAKGTFYHHFESKEKYLYALIERIHREAFDKAKEMVFGSLASGSDLRASVRAFLGQLFYWPEMLFMIKNKSEIEKIFGGMEDGQQHSFKHAEANLFAGIMQAGNIDIRRINPGVVHNTIHALFFMKSSDFMDDESMHDTVEFILDSLMTYVFGGEQ